MREMLDSFGARSDLAVGDERYGVFRLDAVVDDPRRLPVLAARSCSRTCCAARTARNVTADDISAARRSRSRGGGSRAVASSQFMPARVLMQDFTGVPAIVDLAAMRDAVVDLGGDPERVEPAHPRRPRHRPLDHRRRRGRGRRVRAQRASSSSRATASATRSCAGRRRRSGRCACSRRTAASATR